VHRLPAHLRADARRSAQRDAPHGDAGVPARNLRRQSGRGRGDRDRDGSVPAGGDHGVLLRIAAPRLAAGGQRQMSINSTAAATAASTSEVTDTQGMNYLVSLPRRVVTVFLPLGAF